MSKEDERVESLVSELSTLEFENGRLLDDESIRLVAGVRGRNLITDEEWTQIKQFLIDALKFLSGQDAFFGIGRSEFIRCFMMAEQSGSRDCLSNARHRFLQSSQFKRVQPRMKLRNKT